MVNCHLYSTQVLNRIALCVCRYGDHYEWNKAVTCIHNVLSQQRWLEHYGEVVIRNTKSDICTCKITFVKVSTHTHTHTSCPVYPASPLMLEVIVTHTDVLLLFNHLILSYSSLGTGAQITVRMRSRVWFWTGLERWSIVLEGSGMRASSVTHCLPQSASGSPVSNFLCSWSTGKVLKTPD